MKKALLCIITAALLLTVTACGDKDNKANNEVSESESSYVISTDSDENSKANDETENDENGVVKKETPAISIGGSEDESGSDFATKDEISDNNASSDKSGKTDTQKDNSGTASTEKNTSDKQGSTLDSDESSETDTSSEIFGSGQELPYMPID